MRMHIPRNTERSECKDLLGENQPDKLVRSKSIRRDSMEHKAPLAVLGIVVMVWFAIVVLVSAPTQPAGTISAGQTTLRTTAAQEAIVQRLAAAYELNCQTCGAGCDCGC